MTRRVAGTLLPMMMLWATPFTPQGETETGYLSQYAERPFLATLDYRVDAGQITFPARYDVFFATADCDDIGREAWVSIEGGDWELGIAFDCAGHKSTVQWFDEANIVAEVDPRTAKRHDFVGRGGIEATLVWSEK